MTAESGVRSEVSEVVKVEIEEKCGLDMSSYENFPKVGGDCNGVKHVVDGGEEDGNGKDDPDLSYVFVSRSNSPNYDRVGKDLNSDCADKMKSVPEDGEIEVGELRGENGESSLLGVEDNCIAEESADNAPSNSVIVRESSVVKIDGDGGEVAKTEAVEEQNGTLCVDSGIQGVDGEVKVEGEIELEYSNGSMPLDGEVKVGEELRSESVRDPEMIRGSSVMVSKAIDGGIGKSEERNELESTTEVDEVTQSQTKVPEAVVPESQTMVPEADTELEVTEQSLVMVSEADGCELSLNNLESTTEVDEVPQSQTKVPEAVVSESHTMVPEADTELEVSEQALVMVSKADGCELSLNNLESTPEVDVVPQSQTKVPEAVVPQSQTMVPEADAELEVSEQSLVMVSEADECELSLNNLESTVEVDMVPQSQTEVPEAVAPQSQTKVLEAVVPQSQTMVPEADTELEVSEQSLVMVSEADECKLSLNNLESTAEVDVVLQSQTKVPEAVVPQSQTMVPDADTELEVSEESLVMVSEADECKLSLNDLESIAEVDEVLQSQTKVPEAVVPQSQIMVPEADTELEVSEESLVMVLEADECKLSLVNVEQHNLESTAVTQKRQESQVVVIGAVEPQLPGVEAEKPKSEEQTELGSATEVEETLDSQITVSESAKSKSCELDNGDEKLVEENKADFGIEVKAEQVADVLVTDSSGGNLDQCNGSANLTRTDVSLETDIANDSVSDAKVRSATNHVKDGISETEVLNKSIDHCERTPELSVSAESAEMLPSSNICMRSEIKFGTVPEKSGSLPTGSDDSSEVKVECGSSLASESFPTCSGDDIKSENEVENLNVESREIIFPCADDGAKSEIEEKGPVGDDRILPCPVDGANSEIEENGLNGDDRVSCPATDMSSQIEDDGPEVVNVQIIGSHSNSGDLDADDKIAPKETKGYEGIFGDGFSASSPVGSSADATDGRNIGVDTRRRPFRFLIRIPRYDDENLREHIRRAQLQLVEKTQLRDAIRAEIQTKRDNCEDCYSKYDASKSAERAERMLLNSKFREIESVKSDLNRVKSAISVENIDGRIQSLGHRMAHETVTLKEEKQLVRELEQLKHLREQHSSNMMSSQDEVRQALGHSVQLEESLKILKKEVKSLKDKVSEAKVTTDAAEKIYIEESKRLKELQAKFRAADGIRQEAYTHLQDLKKQLYEKNKHFRIYKDDAAAAYDYESSGNRDTLYHHCVNQVERFMELWNKDDEFRREYVRCNTRSTLRRLNTLDGRSLGPDEEPPVLPNVVNERVDRSLFNPIKANSVTVSSTIEQVKQGSSLEGEAADGKTMLNVENQKNQAVKPKLPAKPVLENGSATVSGRDETEETKEEEPQQTKEEQELARKAEELRKAEAAAKLREQRRLEEKAKAKEALERKKRNAEKAQLRAELRAQKEAEQKEKEREKKARKKERKKGNAVEATDGNNGGETDPASENPIETSKEPEMKERAMSVTKRPSRFTKQSKVKSIPSIPPPLRNKGKKKMQTSMWVILAVLVVVALFLFGNNSFSFDLGLHRLTF